MKRFTLTLLVFLSFMLGNIAFARQKAVQKTDNINKFDYVNLPFWKNFNDEQLLDNLIIVYKNNNDLKATANKVKVAQRLVKISLASELPHIAFEGYAGRILDSSTSVYGNVSIANYSETHYLMPLTLNYEVDIWGENRLKTKAQNLRLESEEQEERAVYIGLTSDFAIDYYNLIKIDKLIKLQNQLVSTQEKVCVALNKRYKVGTATINDVIFAQKSLTYLKEELNDLQEKQDVLKNQMSVFLSDRAFSDIKRKNFESIDIKTKIPEEISLDTLSKRPDWVKAQLELKEIGYDVRIAKKDLLPKFNLVGTLGFNAYNIASNHNFLADIGIAPSLDIFDGGRKIQVLKLQKDRYNIARENYDKVILTSMQETNDALYLLKSSERKYNISKDRFALDNCEKTLMQNKTRIGTADNLDLLFKDEQVIISNKQTTSLKIDEIISMINLYKALGGIDYINISSL